MRQHHSVVKTALSVVADKMHVHVANFLIDGNDCNVVMWRVPVLCVIHVLAKVKMKVKNEEHYFAKIEKSCHSQLLLLLLFLFVSNDYYDEGRTNFLCLYIFLHFQY